MVCTGEVMNSAGKPDVTVVISSYDRAPWLRQCLLSLLPDSEPSGVIEVLVVDNNSTDDTAGVVRDLAGRYPSLRYVHEPRQGRSHAKNRGLAAAGADWVAFLDDDARVLPGYVDELLRLVADGRYDLVGGVYLPWYAEGRVDWFRDEYASNAGLSPWEGEMPEDRYASAGVMLVRRSMVEAIGGFDPRLGMGGGLMGYGEETRLQLALRQAGGRIGFCPTWQIEHLTPLSKQSIGWLLRSGWCIGRDSWRTFDRKLSLSALLGVFRRVFTRPLLGVYAELSGDQGINWHTLLVSVARPLAVTLGEFLAGARYLIGRR